MKVIISAGGTGGHIYPAISIIKKIKEIDKKNEILYIGTTTRMEKDIIPNLGYDYVGLDMIGLSKNIFKDFKMLYLLTKNIRKCKTIMKEFKPDIVIGAGGYITVPVLYAAKKLGIKSAIHEQNSIPGKANKFLSKYVDKVFISVKTSKKYFPEEKVVFTGNPRAEDAYTSKTANKTLLGIDNSKKLLLIVMGSLGSSSINNVIKDLIPKFKNKNYEVIFITGKDLYEDYKGLLKPTNVKIVPYLDNMTEVLKVTDLIVSRAGATIISEITAIGIPSILIPSPYVPDNHQYYNALELKNKNACVLIEEKYLNENYLLENIDNILNNDKLYKELCLNSKNFGITNSTTRICKEISEMIKGD